MSIRTYEMARWGFDMIERKEYERVCEENRELKVELGLVTKQLSAMYVAGTKKLGEDLDRVGKDEGASQD